MPHPLSHKYPIPISQLCLVNTDVPAGVGAPPLDTTSLALALSLTLALTLTLYHLPTSYPGGPVHYIFVICELYYIILTW